VKLVEIVFVCIGAVLWNMVGTAIGNKISQSAKETPHWWRVLHPKKYRRHP